MIKFYFTEKEARYIGKMLDAQHSTLMDNSYLARKKGYTGPSIDEHINGHEHFVACILTKFLTTLKLGTLLCHDDFIKEAAPAAASPKSIQESPPKAGT